jgi:hypothetical protein
MSDPIRDKFSPELWDAAADEMMRRAAVELCEGHHVLAFKAQAQSEAFRRAARESQKILDEERSRR